MCTSIKVVHGGPPPFFLNLRQDFSAVLAVYGTCSVDEAGHKFTDPSASTS